MERAVLRVIDWFAGIGGFRLGLEMAGGYRTVAYSEIDPYCCAVYNRRWPGCLNLGDITKLRPELVPEADLWTAGFPCQDVARCGRRAGLDGKKSGLWNDLCELVCEVRPGFLLLENSTSLTRRGLGRILWDLADCGYDAEWDMCQAGAFGAPHPRARLYLLAYASVGRHRPPEAPVFAGRPRPEPHPWWASEPQIPRVDDGLPGSVVRRRALGNAVVPQVVAWIGERIKGGLSR